MSKVDVDGTSSMAELRAFIKTHQLDITTAGTGRTKAAVLADIMEAMGGVGVHGTSRKAMGGVDKDPAPHKAPAPRDVNRAGPSNAAVAEYRTVVAEEQQHREETPVKCRQAHASHSGPEKWQLDIPENTQYLQGMGWLGELNSAKAQVKSMGLEDGIKSRDFIRPQLGHGDHKPRVCVSFGRFICL